jgi:hypothetical protein
MAMAYVKHILDIIGLMTRGGESQFMCSFITGVQLTWEQVVSSETFSTVKNFEHHHKNMIKSLTYLKLSC